MNAVKAGLHDMVERLDQAGMLPGSVDDALLIAVLDDSVAFIDGAKPSESPRVGFLMATLTLGLAALFDAIGEVEDERKEIAGLRKAISAFDHAAGPTAPGVN